MATQELNNATKMLKIIVLKVYNYNATYMQCSYIFDQEGAVAKAIPSTVYSLQSTVYQMKTIQIQG